MNCYNDRTYCSAYCVNTACNKSVLSINPIEYQKDRRDICLLDFSRGCQILKFASNEWCDEIDKRLKVMGVLG